MDDKPKPAELDGRSSNGRFAAGNKCGRGNPNNRKAQQLRNAFLNTITEEDIVEVTNKLIQMAKDGDIQAIKEMLDRALGKSPASIELTNNATNHLIEELTDEELLAIVRTASGGEGTVEQAESSDQPA